ncbi:MAG: ribonuclease HI [Bacteroidetes bacterium]|nr:MAG: ribonuclease HI [Bacteroidota bacterium]
MEKLLKMEIIAKEEGFFLIAVSGENEISRIAFDPVLKKLDFIDENELSGFIQQNEYQLRKILHMKRPETYIVGFTLPFVLTDKKDVAAYNDLNNIVILDRLDGDNIITVRKTGLKGLMEIYTDGSFSKKKGKGGFAVILKSAEGKYTLNTYGTKEKSSSLIELLAAIKGLELTSDEKRVRIVTDSQYVRKGLTEWIVNWRRNNWLTASGTRVKNIKHWKYFDSLSENKYIEFKYVKAHSDQFENTMADLYAKDMAER